MVAPKESRALGSAALLEVQVEAARRGRGLSLVLAAHRARAVGTIDWSVHAHERDLPDGHAVVDGDGEVRHVGELEGEVAREAAVHEAGRGVDEKSQPAQRAL